jgi:hypothetical protein
MPEVKEEKQKRNNIAQYFFVSKYPQNSHFDVIFDESGTEEVDCIVHFIQI